jgi:uncharacterized cupredoxin-like copper-binding protein
MRAKLLSVAVVSVFAATFLVGTATALTRATTTVTIKAQNGDVSGTISSPQPKHCANHRTVTVFKQKGKKQDPAHDSKFGSDTAELQGGKYVWDTGNSGAFGKIYAHAAQTPKCKGGSSKTINSVHGP